MTFYETKQNNKNICLGNNNTPYKIKKISQYTHHYGGSVNL